ncbi:hypothetical protein B0H13DRAFT_2337278 [Mycena leptocephala]|nr:hypothetical protein B0H13DRAFT_2337278 [Mycena leptocephala]
MRFSTIPTLIPLVALAFVMHAFVMIQTCNGANTGSPCINWQDTLPSACFNLATQGQDNVVSSVTLTFNVCVYFVRFQACQNSETALLKIRTSLIQFGISNALMWMDNPHVVDGVISAYNDFTATRLPQSQHRRCAPAGSGEKNPSYGFCLTPYRLPVPRPGLPPPNAHGHFLARTRRELSRSARSSLPPGTQALPHRIQEGGEVSSRDVLPLGFPSVRSMKQTRVLLYRVESLRISLPHPRPREAARRS